MLGLVFIFLDVLAPHGFACKAYTAPQETDFYRKPAFSQRKALTTS